MKFDFNIYLYVLTALNLSKGRQNDFIVKEAIAGGADVIQLWDKELTAKERLEEAIKIRNITRENNVPLLINDRVDLAMAADADGVHLGQDDLPLKYARRLLGDNKIIGISIQTLEQALKAENEGADYIAVSAIFSTPTKPDAVPLGLDFIGNIKENVSIPVITIGGIKKDNVSMIAKAGADCIAVVSAVVAADNVKMAAKELKKTFLAARRTGGEG
ncbi:thiamine phosphate synthase [Candidatus Poribacteria bacterium]|nr:thiamine phosphate synthase [Candidatus Poribacteria bacterium]